MRRKLEGWWQHLLWCVFLPTLFCRLSVVWIDSCTGRTKYIGMRSRKVRKLYRRYRGIRDNHLSNPPPENQVGDLLESCVAYNLSNYSGSVVYGLRQDAHTGVYRCHLHGRPFVYAFSGCGSSHKETVRIAGCGISGGIAGTK